MWFSAHVQSTSMAQRLRMQMWVQALSRKIDTQTLLRVPSLNRPVACELKKSLSQHICACVLVFQWKSVFLNKHSESLILLTRTVDLL